VFTNKLKRNCQIPHTDGVIDECPTIAEEPMTCPVIDWVTRLRFLGKVTSTNFAIRSQLTIESTQSHYQFQIRLFSWQKRGQSMMVASYLHLTSTALPPRTLLLPTTASHTEYLQIKYQSLHSVFKLFRVCTCNGFENTILFSSKQFIIALYT
jgi:hypothetical protein